MAFIGNTVQTQGFTPAIDYFNGNGVTVTFTLSRPIASVAQVIVAIDNVIQNPNSAFTVAGNAITFSSAPLSGTNNIWVEYTSLITTYQAISQDPTVIGDIRATGGYLAEGDFGNSFVDGVIVDYVTGLGRVTVGTAEGIALYNGGTASRTALASWNSSGTLTNTGGAVIQGLTVGKGFGALSQNTALGVSALSSASLTGNYNTAVGYQAGYSNTTGAQNTFIGRLAGYSNTADFGTAVGSLAMQSNTSGASNTALGSVSLNNNTTGSYNVAVGRDSLASNTTASYNTAVGYQAGYSVTTAQTVTYIGYQAGYNATGANNTFVGTQAGYAITSGAKNTIVGRYDGNQGGLDIRTSSNNIVLSDGDGNPRMACESGGNFAIGIAPTASYKLYVYRDDASTAVQFFNNRGNASDTVTSIVLGANTNTSTAYFIYCPQNGVAERFSVRGNGGIYNYQANNSNLSDRREKTDIEPAKSYLDTICAIPVQTFKYVDQTDDEKTLGVIAQDVQAVAPELVSESDWGTEDNPKMRLSIYQTDLQYALMKAIQELNAKVEAQALEIATLKAAK